MTPKFRPSAVSFAVIKEGCHVAATKFVYSMNLVTSVFETKLSFRRSWLHLRCFVFLFSKFLLLCYQLFCRFYFSSVCAVKWTRSTNWPKPECTSGITGTPSCWRRASRTLTFCEKDRKPKQATPSSSTRPMFSTLWGKFTLKFVNWRCPWNLFAIIVTKAIGVIF